MLMQQISIFDVEERVQPTQKQFSVGYYDYVDRFFRVTVPAMTEAEARKRVLRGEVEHPDGRGCLRTMKVKEVKTK